MKRLALVASVALLASACGLANKRSDQNSSAPVSGGADLTQLQQASPTAAPGLISAFGYTEASAGDFLAFYSGNRYFFGMVNALSAQSAQVMGIVGTYDDSSGTIVPTGKRTTCQALVAQAKAEKAAGDTATLSGTVNGQEIGVTSGSTTAVLSRINLGAPPAGGVVVQWGCFDLTTGAFTPEAWSDIQP